MWLKGIRQSDADGPHARFARGPGSRVSSSEPSDFVAGCLGALKVSIEGEKTLTDLHRTGADRSDRIRVGRQDQLLPDAFPTKAVAAAQAVDGIDVRARIATGRLDVVRLATRAATRRLQRVVDQGGRERQGRSRPHEH